MTEGGREQDQGRSHKRRGRPSAETVRLLDAWQEVLRAELRAVVDALKAEAPAGLLKDAKPSPLIPLDDARRDRLVDRGVKVAKELGASIDDGDPADGNATTETRNTGRKRKVDFGGE